MAGAAPHRGRRKDTQGRLCGRGGSGAGRSEAGQELLRATRPSHAVTYASCQGLTLHNRVRLDLESCHLTLRHLYVGASRATGLQHEVAHLEEHAPLPGHQPHVPGLHKRAAPAARELRGARHAVAGGVPEEAALQVHLALHVLALGAHLDGALQLALKLGAGGPRKGLLEDDHVVDDGLLHPIRPQLQVGVARKAHAHPLGPVVLEVAGLPQHLHVRLAHQRALTGVLYGHELSPLGIGLNVQPECKLHCEVRLFLSVGKKSGPMNARVFLVVAVAVILLFKNAETPGAFLRHQVGGQGLRGGGLGGRLPGHRVEI